MRTLHHLLPAFPLLACCALGASDARAQPGSSDSPRVVLERAEARFRAGDLPAAIDGYEAFLASEPGATTVRARLVEAYSLAKRLDEALEQYARLVEAGAPESPIALGLARALRDDDRTADAARVLTPLVAAEPRNETAVLSLLECRRALGDEEGARQLTDLLLERAMELHQAGDLLGAIDSYSSLLEQVPDRADARSNLGAAYVRLGRLQEGVEAYRRALEGVGDETGALSIRFNLALALYKAGQIADAAEELRRVVGAQPDNANAVFLLADCELRMGRNAEVLDLLAPHVARWGEERVYAYLVGTAQLRLGDVERSQYWVDKVMAQGDSAEARVLMGAVKLQASDFPAAAEELRRAVALAPGLPTVHSMLGRALLGMGDRDAALAAFLEELEVNPADFESNLNAGMLRKDEGKNDQALAYLERARRVRPDDPAVQYALASVFVATNRTDEALALLERVVESDPDFVQGHVMLATVYYRLDRREDGDRQRAIVQQLNAEQQARQPGSSEALGPAYEGESGKRQQPRP